MIFLYIILFDSHHNHARMEFSFNFELTTVVNSLLESSKLESLLTPAL